MTLNDNEEQSLCCLHACSLPFACARGTVSDSKREGQGCRGYDTTRDTSPTTDDRNVISTRFDAEKLSGVAGVTPALTDFSHLVLEKK